MITDRNMTMARTSSESGEEIKALPTKPEKSTSAAAV